MASRHEAALRAYLNYDGAATIAGSARSGMLPKLQGLPSDAPRLLLHVGRSMKLLDSSESLAEIRSHQQSGCRGFKVDTRTNRARTPTLKHIMLVQTLRPGIGLHARRSVQPERSDRNQRSSLWEEVLTIAPW